MLNIEKNLIRSDEWVHSACAYGAGSCPLKVKVRDGRIVDIKGEDVVGWNGRLCEKAIAGIGGRIYAPDRILYPLKRVGERGEARFERCTWNEVIDAVASKLREYIKAGHPEYFETWWGCPAQTDNVYFLHYWSFVTGTGISYMHGQVCFGDNIVEKMLTFGENHSSSPLFGIADWTRTKYAVIAGQNFPGTSTSAGLPCNVPFYFLANKAKENGCKFTVIDPKLADTAPWCSEWIPIEPGGDNVLALAIANVIINEELYDEDFLLKYSNAPQLIEVDNYKAVKDGEGCYLVWDNLTKTAKTTPVAGEVDGLTLGIGKTFETTIQGEAVKCKTVFQLLTEQVEKYTPEEAAKKIASFSADKIVEIARELGKHKPSVIVYPGMTSGRYSNWFQTLRAYSIVNLLLGNFEKPGGFYFMKHAFDLGNGWPTPPEVPEYREGKGVIVPTWGGGEVSIDLIDKAPCYKKPRDYHPSVVALPWLHFDAIDQGKLRAIFTTSENAALTQPDSKWVYECLKKLDLIIVGEQVPKEFVDWADYVIPEASWLEKYHMYHHPYLGVDDKEHAILWMRSAVIPPQGSSKPPSWFLIEVAKKIGLGGYFEKLDLKHGWWNRMLKKAGLYPKVTSMNLIKDGPYLEDRPISYNLLFKPIATRSGRFEIYSNDLAEECYHNQKSRYYDNPHLYPLPIAVPIAEPNGLDEFYLLTGKAVWHQKSATQHNRYLMEDAIEGDCSYTTIYINADRAEKLGINDGDLVDVKCVGPKKKDDPCVYNEAVIGVKERGIVKVTEGLHPKAAWIYFAAGHKSRNMLPKAREGIAHNWLLPFSVSPYSGGTGKNYSIVKIHKVSEEG